jgi:putative heme-binding domain-containing protein
LLIFSGAANAQQQGDSTPVAAGAQLYRANCVTCHGEAGNAVAGVDFRGGQFRRAASDDDLVRIIGEGVPGTAMPPFNLPVESRRALIAYLHSLHASGAATAGDAAAGRVLFEGKGGCMNCHRVDGKGPRTGPDLSDVGSTQKAPELRQSLIDPNAVVRVQNRYIRAVLRDGTVVTGRRLNENTDSIQLIDEHERLISLPRASLREYKLLDTSSMPSCKDTLTPDEITDVVAYLQTLKGVGPASVPARGGAR